MVTPLLVALLACYKVEIETHPSGAIVTLASGQTVTTPASGIGFGVRDFFLPIHIAAPGYRPLEVLLDLEQVRVAFGGPRLFRVVPSKLEYVLVPVHGPAGTWTEDDVP